MSRVLTCQRTRTALLVVVVVVVATMHSGAAEVQGVVDYCAENTYRSNSTWLQFTKEISSKEYAIGSHFKSLHCCAKGYSSIQWHKDGKPYPWPGGVSNLILYPESANQTIYSESLGQSDAGSYTCVVSNDTHQHTHTIHLHVIDAPGYTGAPLPTYEPPDQQVRLGADARIFCEAFVGRIDLPDAHNEVMWRRGDVNASFHHQARFRQIAKLRENDQVLGSHLLLSGVRSEDLGLYVCIISNTAFQSAEFHARLLPSDAGVGGVGSPAASTVGPALRGFAVALVALVTVVALYARYGRAVRRRVKDWRHKGDEGDDRRHDLLVCFCERDAHFALTVLIPTLETRYSHTCCAQQLSAQPALWPTELSSQLEKSRRLVCVLSPGVVDDAWDVPAVTSALAILTALHPSVICVALQALPQCGHTDNDATLARLSRRAGVVEWRTDGAFWSTVRPRLPPQRGSTNPLQPNARARRANSNESLEVLV